MQLLQEDALQQLTNEEIVNACNVRSLPLGENVSFEEMRMNLKDYLNFFSEVCEKIENEIDFENYDEMHECKLNCLKLFTIYMPVMLYDINYFK